MRQKKAMKNVYNYDGERMTGMQIVSRALLNVAFILSVVAAVAGGWVGGWVGAAVAFVAVFSTLIVLGWVGAFIYGFIMG